MRGRRRMFLEMTVKRIVMTTLLAMCWCAPLRAQDIRGLEVCTAEKDMARRTGCLQANVQFLQAALDKATRDAQEKISAAYREIAAQKTELAAQKADIAALKDALAKAQADLAELKKARPAK
jgi:septal ring factor EnvC (AmiA/AmiB activator)